MRELVGFKLWRTTRHKRLVSEAAVFDEDSGEDLDYKELVTWLKIRGEYDACSVLTASTTQSKRGLFASRDIKAGECILSISLGTMMTPDGLPMEFQRLLPDDISEWAQLALLLLFEKRAGKASVWFPYISCLPRWGTIHSTAFWRREELAMLKESSLSHETMQRRISMREEYAALQQIFQRYEDAFGGPVSYASFKHAYITVCSRAWRIAGLRKLAMVPFADFLNHDWSSKAVFAYNSERACAELYADKNYTAGEQLVINYGPLSNASLALDFGFTLPYNPWDKVELWLCISRRDKLRKEKLQCLHSRGMLTLENPDGSDSGGMSFTIREVRSVTGEGKELPQSLFTMARIICATSIEELELGLEKVQDGSKEIRAFTLILARLEAQIQRHIEAILAFRVYKTPTTEESTTLLCTEMAEAILGGELRVLRSASAWLKHRCTILP